MGTHVLITTSCGSMPYFLTSKAFSTVASRPFNADMLSANLQLIGMLGFAEPTYFTLSANLSIPAGKLFAINGLDRIPSRNNFSDSRETEYAPAGSPLFPLSSDMVAVQSRMQSSIVKET